MINISNTSKPSVKILTIAVAGPDAAKFLQGQLTCDVMALQDGQVVLGAYCNIKGKVESLFYLERQADNYYLHLNADLLDSTFNELKKYSIFSKVTLSIVTKDLPSIVVQPEVDAIMAKIPQLYTQTIGLFFPHDLNLPQLNAVSFNKGCYRGQEIVARMQYRGNLKRSMYLFTCDNNILIAPATTINDQETKQGNVVRFCITNNKILGLAVINDAATKHILLIDNIPIELL